METPSIRDYQISHSHLLLDLIRRILTIGFPNNRNICSPSGTLPLFPRRTSWPILLSHLRTRPTLATAMPPLPTTHWTLKPTEASIAPITFGLPFKQRVMTIFGSGRQWLEKQGPNCNPSFSSRRILPVPTSTKTLFDALTRRTRRIYST